ncbi:MAG: LysR family transcriptional regulator [Hyphomicrobiaceae bacterium]
MHKLRWDDLQILKAVAEHGSANAAADVLGLNHSTVLRRVNAFENSQGVKLFERHHSGYRPTSAGHALLEAVSDIDRTVHGIQRTILGQDTRLAGTVTLTTTDSIAGSIVIEKLSEFRKLHPDIGVNLIMTNVRLDLTSLDADISVRPSRNPPERLIGRRACGLAFGVYCLHASHRKRMNDLSRIDNWIGISGELENSPVGDWLDKTVPKSAIVARANSFMVLRDMIRNGLGAAVLPCCLGDRSKGLHGVTGPIPELETSLWVLTHPDLKKSARLSALSDFLVRALRAERALLEGGMASSREAVD